MAYDWSTTLCLRLCLCRLRFHQTKLRHKQKHNKNKLVGFSCTYAYAYVDPSSETQGQSVGSGKKAGRKFSSKCGRAPGYRLSPNYFQTFKLIPAPDWAQKMLCIIVPNREQLLLSSFREFVHDGYCLAILAWFVHQACAYKGNFLLVPNQKQRNYR